MRPLILPSLNLAALHFGGPSSGSQPATLLVGRQEDTLAMAPMTHSAESRNSTSQPHPHGGEVSSAAFPYLTPQLRPAHEGFTEQELLQAKTLANLKALSETHRHGPSVQPQLRPAIKPLNPLHHDHVTHLEASLPLPTTPPAAHPPLSRSPILTAYSIYNNFVNSLLPLDSPTLRWGVPIAPLYRILKPQPVVGTPVEMS